MNFLYNRFKRATDMWGVVLIILVAILVLNNSGFNLFGTQQPATGGTGTTIPPPIQLAPDGVCPIGAVVEDTTVTFDMKDKYLASTSLLGSIYVKDDANSPVNKTTDGGTATYSPGDKLEIWWDMETPAQYATKTDTTVPCLGTVVLNADVYRNGSITTQLFSEDDGLALMAGAGAGNTASANNENMAVGDVVTLTGSITGQFERGFPYGFSAVVNFNKTAFDGHNFRMSFNGVNAEEGVVPSTHTKPGSTLAAADWGTKAFKVPPIISNQKLDWTYTLDADDTYDPGASDAINITFYDYDYFVADDGSIQLGVEDDNGNDVGASNVQSGGNLMTSVTLA